MKKIVISAFVTIVVVTGFLAYPRLRNRYDRTKAEREQHQVQRPEPAVIVPDSVQSSSTSSISSESGGVNLDVPFTSQAPLLNWDPLHEEACEEASVLMVLRYFAEEGIQSSEDAEQAIQQLVKTNEELGYDVDATAEEVAVLVRYMDPSLVVSVHDHPSLSFLKSELKNGSLFIAPLQGQWLGNPYFTQPGPRYHMLVIRGFTDSGYFITNDPGTKRGEGYVYRFQTILDALRDWNGGDVENGVPRVILVRRG